MTDFTVITDYSLNTPWVLTDSTLQDLAIGRLASLGSQQGSQLRSQVNVLQEQIAAVEALKEKVTDFLPPNFDRFVVKSDGTLGLVASLDISTLSAILLPPGPTSPFDVIRLDDGSRPDPNYPTVTQLINFYAGFKDLVTLPPPDGYRITYQTSTISPPQQILLKNLPAVDPATGQRVFFVSDGITTSRAFMTNAEGFVNPPSTQTYQQWLQAAALKLSATTLTTLTADGINAQGETMQWRVVTPGARSGTVLFAGVATETGALSLLLQTSVGSIVHASDGKYYRVTASMVPGISVTQYEEVVPVTPVATPLIVAPTSATLRDIRSQYSEKILRETQRNSAQQLLTNKLLISQNYHLDAATNVLKAFTDLHARLAGSV